MWRLASRSQHMFSVAIINLVTQQTYEIQPLSYDARLIAAVVSLKPRQIGSVFIQQNKYYKFTRQKSSVFCGNFSVLSPFNYTLI